MTNKSKVPAGDSELIQRVVDALIARAGPRRGTEPAIASSARKGRRYSVSERKEILAAAKIGKTPEELEVQFGVARETVSRWSRREAQNVAPNPPAAAAVATAIVPPQSAPIMSEADLESAEPRKDVHKGYHSHWKEVLKVWRARPGIGPAQIQNQLHRVGIKITVATVRKILEENGYTPPKAAVKEIEINRYEAVRPLELVHMDFKHFYINKAKVYLLLFQDDFSRFLCGHRMTDSENMKAVIEVFEECVNRHGKMQAVMTDAGSAFYSWNGVNRFQKLLEGEYGVDQIKAGSPRSNGKIENVNKQIEKELLNVKMYASLEEAETALQDWIRFYNFGRTHMGLPPGTVPADRFMPGWNESGPHKEEGSAEGKVSAEQAEQTAWMAVLEFAQSRMKRAA